MGTAKGVGIVREHWGCQGIEAIRGVGSEGALGAGREYRCSGASRGRGSIRGIGAPRGCRVLGPIRGCRGALEVAGGLGARPHWAQSRVPALPVVPLGE